MRDNQLVWSSANVCKMAAIGGHLVFFDGHRLTVSPGIAVHAMRPLGDAILKCLNGHGTTAAPVTKKPVDLPHQSDALTYCNGFGRKVVRRISLRAARQPGQVMLRYCNGQYLTAAPRKNTLSPMQPWWMTRTRFVGLEQKAAHGMQPMEHSCHGRIV